MRQVNDYEVPLDTITQGVQFGGTGLDDFSKFPDAVGLIHTNNPRPGETPLTLDSAGLLDTKFINPADARQLSIFSSTVTRDPVSGNLICTAGSVITFQISDFDSMLAYSATVDGTTSGVGGVNTTAGTFTYSVPAAAAIRSLIVTCGTLTRTYALECRRAMPTKPSITTPSQGAVNQGATVNASGSAYVAGSAGAFKEAVWQIDESPSFKNPTETRVSSGVTTSFTGLLANKNYFLRLAYNDINSQVSLWSDTIGFTTKATMLPSLEVATLAPTLLVTENSGSTSFTASGSFVAAAAGVDVDGRLVLTADNVAITDGGYTEADRAMYIFGRGPTSNWVMQTKGTSSLKKFQRTGAGGADYARHVSISTNGRWVSASVKFNGDRRFCLNYVFTSAIGDNVLTPPPDLCAGDYFGPHRLNADGSKLIMVSGDGSKIAVFKYGVNAWISSQVISINALAGVGKKSIALNDDNTLLFVAGVGGMEIFRIMESQSTYLVSVKAQAYQAAATDVGQMVVSKAGDLVAVRLVNNITPRVEVIEFTVSTNTFTSKSIAMPAGEADFGKSIALAVDAVGAYFLYVGSPNTADGGKVRKYSGVHVGSTASVDLILQHSNAQVNPTGADESAYGQSVLYSSRYTELFVADKSRIHVLR